jgi:hypothetical protein
LRAK